MNPVFELLSDGVIGVRLRAVGLLLHIRQVDPAAAAPKALDTLESIDNNMTIGRQYMSNFITYHWKDFA